MKIRMGFVSNSSSTAFCITNISNVRKTLVDFVKENSHIITDYLRKYESNTTVTRTQENLIDSAKARDMSWKARETKVCSFGDEQGDLVGQVFDYMLRDGGLSKSFEWRFDHWQR